MLKITGAIAGLLATVQDNVGVRSSINASQDASAISNAILISALAIVQAIQEHGEDAAEGKP